MPTRRRPTRRAPSPRHVVPNLPHRATGHHRARKSRMQSNTGVTNLQPSHDTTPLCDRQPDPGIRHIIDHTGIERWPLTGFPRGRHEPDHPVCLMGGCGPGDMSRFHNDERWPTPGGAAGSAHEVTGRVADAVPSRDLTPTRWPTYRPIFSGHRGDVRLTVKDADRTRIYSASPGRHTASPGRHPGFACHATHGHADPSMAVRSRAANYAERDRTCAWVIRHGIVGSSSERRSTKRSTKRTRRLGSPAMTATVSRSST